MLLIVTIPLKVFRSIEDHTANYNYNNYYSNKFISWLISSQFAYQLVAAHVSARVEYRQVEHVTNATYC